MKQLPINIIDVDLVLLYESATAPDQSLQLAGPARRRPSFLASHAEQGAGIAPADTPQAWAVPRSPQVRTDVSQLVLGSSLPARPSITDLKAQLRMERRGRGTGYMILVCRPPRMWEFFDREDQVAEGHAGVFARTLAEAPGRSGRIGLVRLKPSVRRQEFIDVESRHAAAELAESSIWRIGTDALHSSQYPAIS